MLFVTINVVLNPDPVPGKKVREANARLRENDPDSFALDAHHPPPVSTLQGLVKPADDLHPLQQRILCAVAPFALDPVPSEAIAPGPVGAAMSQPSVASTSIASEP